MFKRTHKTKCEKGRMRSKGTLLSEGLGAYLVQEYYMETTSPGGVNVVNGLEQYHTRCQHPEVFYQLLE